MKESIKDYLREYEDFQVFLSSILIFLDWWAIILISWKNLSGH